ncbi:MAG: hypothetical protein J1E37_05475 [Prevotella sp.]|nr:hypothetical protein [Prevotella sp.]
MNKRIFGSLLACLVAVQIIAQESSTLSPYSQYGLGVLADQSLGFSRGMGGLGYGLRNGRQINMQNPASYSVVDSLTMLFDIGMSGKITNFKEGGKSVNSNTGNFDYAVASFRLFKNVGLGVGIVPFSNIGYDYISIDNSTGTIESYSGDGGFSQLFLGAGWEFAKGFSLGFNLSYFWGKYDKSVTVQNSDGSANVLTRQYSTTVRDYKLDFGLQWQKLVNPNNLLTIGLTTSIGHNLHANADVQTITTNTTTGVSNIPDPAGVENAFSLPWAFGVGATLVHKKSLTVGFDYSLQRWGALDYPVYDSQGYSLKNNYYNNRHKIAVGLGWVPNPLSRKFFQVLQYRIGASYATPYYKIKGTDGPSELTLSAGLGIPVSRSMVHISGQWVRSAADNYITENMFRISLGLTFNERWFAKWKVD